MASSAVSNGLGEFLQARRQAVRPEAVGLPAQERRRVPGLRREEVATLARISVNYYIRLERGEDRNPSPEVVNALAAALTLDEHATAHLHGLARPARTRGAEPEGVRDGVVRLVAGWHHQPALVLSRHMEVLAANPLAVALHPGFAPGTNLVRFAFSDPRAREVYRDWAEVAADSVGSLRAAVGADLDDPALVTLVDELSAASPEFRELWATHDTYEKYAGRKRFEIPRLGRITLDYECFGVPASSGQTLVVYSAEPGSADERTLRLLVADEAHHRAAVPL